MKKQARLFKGLFKFRRETLVLHCHAVSKKQARIRFCDQITRKSLVSRQAVLDLFAEGNENFDIIEVEND
jgi:hypothetical protein